MKVFSGVIAGLVAILLCSCSGARPTEELGLDNNRLHPCPDSPNCVSTSETDPDQRILPFRLQVEAPAAWAIIVETVTELPRTRIVAVTDNYLHAECRSAVLGFVDDLELHLRPEEQQVGIRSGARLGYYDFGVNRNLVKELHSKLNYAGVVMFWFTVNWRIHPFELVYNNGGIHHAKTTKKLYRTRESIHPQAAPC